MTPQVNETNYQDIVQRITALENKRTNLFDLFGLFQTVSATPTGIPRSVYDQVKIYVNSTTYRLYIYDFTGNVWHYTTLT